MDKPGFVYMLMSPNCHVIYTGVTSDLKKRVWEHKNNLVAGFTKRYKVHKPVYYEVVSGMRDAILREKQLKGGSCEKKMEWICKMNPKFEDLYDHL